MAGEKLINIMKDVSKKANPSTNNTDLVYGVVKSTNPLVVLVDNRLELTEDFLSLSPFCYKTGFSFSISDHTHAIAVSPIDHPAHSHTVEGNVEGHTHTVDGKTSSKAGSQSLSMSTSSDGAHYQTPSASASVAGGHTISVNLWGDLAVADKLVMLRVAEGQHYIILYRDKLNISVNVS